MPVRPPRLWPRRTWQQLGAAAVSQFGLKEPAALILALRLVTQRVRRVSETGKTLSALSRDDLGREPWAAAQTSVCQVILPVFFVVVRACLAGR